MPKLNDLIIQRYHFISKIVSLLLVITDSNSDVVVITHVYTIVE